MRIDLPGADIQWLPQWLPAPASADLFERLVRQVPWEVHRIRMFGQMVDSPRLSCWVGDADAAYRYSGTRFEPRPWTPALQELRARLAAETGCAFNSVLLNRYRDGHDSMGWHSDDERELGPQPLIASLSLGATRRFAFRHRRERPLRRDLDLGPGDLLLMGGDTQALYHHSLPRTAKPVGERINLTFRLIGVAPAGQG